jgi:hypothetical protein
MTGVMSGAAALADAGKSSIRRKPMRVLLLAALIAGAPLARAADDACVTCHEKVSPQIVTDWRLSLHSKQDVGCSTCHGEDHKTAEDAGKAQLPTPETCAPCHGERVEQFKNGKHALAWAAMKAMPTAHGQPAQLMEGLKGCGGCHKLGLKTEAEAKEMAKHSGGFGNASCDACHTRHTFSRLEARQPQACQTCHMGFDHPQWEMYSSSKHGVRNDLKQRGLLPASAAAPTCQTCHMPGGDHAVNTAWGFLAVRLPMPEGDAQWTADRATILQGLGVLDPAGKPTARLEVVKAAKVARLTQEEWQASRDKMLAVCQQCHAGSFAKAQLANSDGMIREADHLMAEAIRLVAGLYQDGILPKPAGYASAFPDLLTFHDAPTVIEQKLFVMFLEHRMRAFQGSFHASPDYALWYGWSEMQRDAGEIRELAAQLRREHATAKVVAKTPPAAKK